MLFMFEDVYLTLMPVSKKNLIISGKSFKNRLTEFKTQMLYTVYTRNIHTAHFVSCRY